MENINEKENRELLQKYLEGRATPGERLQVEAWYSRLVDQQPLNGDINLSAAKAESWKRLELLRPRVWPYYAAASVLVIFFLGWLWLGQVQQPKFERAVASEILPATKKASLVVNGKTLLLSGSSETELQEAGAGEVMRNANGQLVYGTSRNVTNVAAKVELIVPKGGQYHIVLPDGTKVWMNANSKLIYPTRFVGKDRRVELVGEGYFEVSADPKHPFMVTSQSIVIQVLGTHFNVRSSNTRTTTTLSEGKVAISVPSTNLRTELRPGQQAIYVHGKLSRNEVNAQDYMAWTKGDFVFKDAPLEDVIEQLVNWYDLEPSTSVPAGVMLNAELSNKKPLVTVLGSLSAITGKKFILKERRIVIE